MCPGLCFIGFRRKTVAAGLLFFASSTLQHGYSLMIILKNVALRRGTKVLLDSATVSINPGEKVGLVGRNGAGKSSLFAVLNGSLHEDGGDFSIPSQWRMAQVAQDMPETSQTATSLWWRAISPCWRRGAKWRKPRPVKTTCAWHMPTPR
jgi:ABC-type Mn2+/Zn2+ transport system ATPase subunit